LTKTTSPPTTMAEGKTRPATPAKALAEVIADLAYLTGDCPERVIDPCVARNLGRLKAIHANLLAESVRKVAWARLALMNRHGDLLHYSSPPGAWMADGQHDARTWESLAEYQEWLDTFGPDYRAWLGRSEDGWKLVELETRVCAFETTESGVA
jgi:hypothetical protein